MHLNNQRTDSRLSHATVRCLHEDRLLVAMAAAPTEDFQFTGLQPEACEHNMLACCLFFAYNLLGALVYSSVDSTGYTASNPKPSLH